MKLVRHQGKAVNVRTLSRNLGGFTVRHLHLGDEEPELCLENLRKAVTEGSELLSLAMSIWRAPSKSIVQILKLKEVYNAKDYLSTVPVPEVVYIWFASLRKQIENLGFYMEGLEKALADVRASIDAVLEEISKFRPSSVIPTEEKVEAEKPILEPSLVQKNEETN